MATFHKLKIASVTRETPKAVKVSFDVPEHLKADFYFKAGQYITLKTEINNETVEEIIRFVPTLRVESLLLLLKKLKEGLFLF